MLNVTELVGFGVGGNTAPTLTFNQVWSYFPGGGLSGRSITMNIGAPGVGRKVIVIITSNDGIPHSITGTPTLNGVPMTPLVQQNGVRMPAGVWIILEPSSNTTGVVSWTTNDGDVDGQQCATYSLYGSQALLPDFSQALFYGGASVSVTESGVTLIAVSWSWQASAGAYSAPLTPDVTNAYAQGLLSCGHGENIGPVVISPGLSVPYNGGLYVAYWR